MLQTTKSTSDFYMPMLASLSDDDKLDLIAKLTISMHSASRKNCNQRPDIRTCFSGEWENGKSTVEVAEGLREGRYYDLDKSVEW